MSIRHTGQTERWVATFRDADGEVFDPDDPSFEITDPDGAAETYVYPDDAEIVRVSEGVYRYDMPWSAVGRWTARAFSTSPAGTRSKVRTVVD